MDKKITLPQLEGDVLLVRLAREIAMEQHELHVILDKNGVSAREFARIERSPRFQRYLHDEIVNWNSALNTAERVKMKSSAMIEEWLPEAFAQMHGDAPLLHKNDLAKLVARLGNLDKGAVGVENGGERFSVTINLGADHKLNFQKDQLPSKVIEGSTND